MNNADLLIWKNYFIYSVYLLINYWKALEQNVKKVLTMTIWPVVQGTPAKICLLGQNGITASK